MAKIKGICKNIDGDCSLAFNKTVQEAEKDDFVCSECGAPLKEAAAAPVKQGGSSNKLIPIIIGAVVAVGAVVGCGFAMGWFDSHTDKEELAEGSDGSLTIDIPETDVETGDFIVEDGKSEEVTPAEETALQESAQTKEEVKDVAPAKVKETAPAASGKNLGYGYYSGSYPTGVGTIKINRPHTFETTSGSVDAGPGDMVVGAKFKDGKLVQGELHSADGSRTWMAFGAI